jgi:acetylornithine deacetylase/succinyl-diaminopimelate desuccinylase-like protein
VSDYAAVRVLERLDEIYAIGATRAGYSAEEDSAHRLAAEWMREAGLEPSADEAGNLIGRRGAARVWTGSHLDSVPNGGKFDGALGVVGAIEAAEQLPDAELAVVAFRAEETGPMGSRRLKDFPDGFIEVHIEQGPVLASLGEPLGLVTAVSAQARGAMTFEGRAAHAGTTPMAQRSDALVEAAKFILHVRECAKDGALATVGAVEIEPGATNVVPERVTVAVDARASTAEGLATLIEAIGFEPTWQSDPVAMSGPPLEALRAVVPNAPELVSGGGHDAMVLAGAGVPAAMLFVRSLNGGASHSPEELSSEEDIALAVDALTEVLARLSTSDMAAV